MPNLTAAIYVGGVIINVDQFETIVPYPHKPEWSRVNMRNGNTIDVNESVERIWQLVSKVVTSAGYAQKREDANEQR